MKKDFHWELRYSETPNLHRIFNYSQLHLNDWSSTFLTLFLSKQINISLQFSGINI